MGYLVVPPAWVTVIKRAKWLCDRQSPLLAQYVLTECLNEGHFERHLRRMRHLYNQRRQTLVHSLTHYLGARVTLLGENAGIHLMVKIDTTLSDEVVIQKAQDLGVGLTSAQKYYLEAPKTGEFILGYSQLDDAQIEQGVKRIAQIFNALP